MEKGVKCNVDLRACGVVQHFSFDTGLGYFK